MIKEKSIAIIGGDRRQEFIDDILSEKGYKCSYENSDVKRGISLIEKADTVIFPVPFSKDGNRVYSDNGDFILCIEDAVKKIRKDALVFAGNVNEPEADLFSQRGISLFDICSDHTFAEYNAALTVQGAVGLLLMNTERHIAGKKVLISGFGKIGKALGIMLRSMNMEVWIAARNPFQLKMAESNGLRTLRLNSLKATVEYFDFIFNTVPHKIFFKKDVSAMKTDCVYFELASKPFGADKADFTSENKKYVSGGGLPGKFVPYSAAEIICEIIVNTSERRQEHG